MSKEGELTHLLTMQYSSPALRSPKSKHLYPLNPDNLIQPPNIGPHNWTSGLEFCCSDMSPCCYSMLCPGCAACDARGYSNQENGGNKCLGCLANFPPAWCCVAHLARSRVKDMYDMPPASCEDCFVSFFCPCCALSQTLRELKARRQLAMGRPVV